ncbi:MAG TPA: Wzz/FepE/Etk N-terminal domain-containing protein, partial [Flavisolibacter sp.]
MEEEVVIHNEKRERLSLNIKELFFKYIRFLPLYILCVAIALFGAYIYLRYATEFYRSSGQLIIRDEKNGGGMSDRLEQAMQSDAQKNIQTEIAILQSRPLMERAVERLGLNFNYAAKGNIKEVNIYKLAPFRIEALELTDSSQGFTLAFSFLSPQSFKVNQSVPVSFGQVFENQFGRFRLVRTSQAPISPEIQISYQPTPQQASSLLGGIAVAPSQTPGIVNISMETTNPHLSADVINALMEVYQEVTIEDKNVSTLNTLKFIDDYLKKSAREIGSITRQLVAYQKNNNIISPETQTTNYYSRVEMAHGREQEQRMLLNSALQIQDYLQRNAENVVPSSLGINDPTLGGLITAYNTAQIERKTLLENALPGHVIVQQKAEELGVLRSKILENIKN